MQDLSLFFFLDIDMYLIAEGFDLEKKRYESQGNNNKKKKEANANALD